MRIAQQLIILRRGARKTRIVRMRRIQFGTRCNQFFCELFCFRPVFGLRGGIHLGDQAVKLHRLGPLDFSVRRQACDWRLGQNRHRQKQVGQNNSEFFHHGLLPQVPSSFGRESRHPRQAPARIAHPPSGERCALSGRLCRGCRDEVTLRRGNRRKRMH